MLVVEQRDKAFRAFHHRDDFIEEPFAGILALPVLVQRVIAMLTDGQHGVHRQFPSAEAQRFVDGLEDRDLEFLRHAGGHVVRRKLVAEERNNVDTRIGEFAVEQIRFQKVLENDVRVGAVRHVGENGGDSRTFRRLRLRNGDMWDDQTARDGRSRAGEEMPA